MRTWIARKREIVQGVVWCVFGLKHVPRPEDWSVVPVETSRIGLKPVPSSKRNPALDFPSSKQNVNQSIEFGRPIKEGGGAVVKTELQWILRFVLKWKGTKVSG